MAAVTPPVTGPGGLVATTEDFQRFVAEVDATDPSWALVYEDPTLKLWKKNMSNSPITAIKMHTYYTDVEPEVLYDVLHDHYFRREWDNNMIEGSIVQQIDGFNEVGYYAAKMPTPMANRDFCNHRTWRVFPERNEWVIFNHSVPHEGCPDRKGFVRGWSHLGGYIVRRRPEGGCILLFYSQSDPKGWLPTSIVNWAMTKLSPKMVSTIHENALKYPAWKAKNKSDWKPWLTGYDVNEEPYARYKKSTRSFRQSTTATTTEVRPRNSEDFLSSLRGIQEGYPGDRQPHPFDMYSRLSPTIGTRTSSSGNSSQIGSSDFSQPSRRSGSSQNETKFRPDGSPQSHTAFGEDPLSADIDNDPAYNFAYDSKLTSTSSSPSRKRPPPDQQATFSGSGLGVESSSQVEGGDIDVGTGSYYGRGLVSRGSKRRRPQASIPILFGLKEREQYRVQSTGKVIWDHTAISDEQMDSYLLQCQTKPGMLEAHLENLHQSSYQVDVALKALESPNCYTLADSWTPMEHEVFKSALMQYGKKFDSIAEHCHINQEKCVRHYYLWRHTPDFKSFKHALASRNSKESPDEAEDSMAGGDWVDQEIRRNICDICDYVDSDRFSAFPENNNNLVNNNLALPSPPIPTPQILSPPSPLPVLSPSSPPSSPQFTRKQLPFSNISSVTSSTSPRSSTCGRCTCLDRCSCCGIDTAYQVPPTPYQPVEDSGCEGDDECTARLNTHHYNRNHNHNYAHNHHRHHHHYHYHTHTTSNHHSGSSNRHHNAHSHNHVHHTHSGTHSWC